MWSDWGTIDVTSHAVPAPRADLHAPDATASLDEPQRRPSASVVEAAAAPAAVAPDGGFHAYSYDVQRQADAGAPADSAAVHAVAAQGVAGSGGPLPFADRIGASFGAHDVSDVRAHVGGQAAAASDALGARAYATGRDIAFAGTPDLHTAAHEAAHVVQQRAGVSLKGGVGEAGDPYEQHANAVADAVVAGRSAEPLLDAMAGSGGGGGVQRQAVQFWDGHEHRAVGNLGAILATGNAEFRTGEISRLRQSFHPTRPGETFDDHQFTTGSIDGMGIHQSTDPTLVGLEQRGRGVNRVRTNDRYSTDPETHQTETIPSSISFGAANEFGGDYNKTPDALAREHDDDDPVGHDFLVMVDVATSNINHFYPLNGEEYRTHHAAAVALAQRSFQAAQAGNAAQASELTRQAILKEGFAAHFLADTFAAGHMAPRALDRISTTGLGEDELGLNRSKHWHDALNAVTGSPGLPTTRGYFHGDDTMTGRELAIIGNDVGASLREVVTTAAGRAEAANISLAAPNVAEILATRDYGPIWRGMMGDYEQDLRGAERRGSRDTVTSDGGTTTNVREMAGDMRENIFGGERVALTRLASSEWNGATLNFSVTVDGRPAPAGTQRLRAVLRQGPRLRSRGHRVHRRHDRQRRRRRHERHRREDRRADHGHRRRGRHRHDHLSRGRRRRRLRGPVRRAVAVHPRPQPDPPGHLRPQRGADRPHRDPGHQPSAASTLPLSGLGAVVVGGDLALPRHRQRRARPAAAPSTCASSTRTPATIATRAATSATPGTPTSRSARCRPCRSTTARAGSPPPATPSIPATPTPWCSSTRAAARRWRARRSCRESRAVLGGGPTGRDPVGRVCLAGSQRGINVGHTAPVRGSVSVVWSR
jgi:hypothetical protein